MKVQIKNQDVVITADQVDSEVTVTWFASNVCEGVLLDTRTFRCWATPEQWAKFMA
jgi:hypothetical protein